MESWMKPMLCSPVDDVPVGDYVMEAKFDGWRLLVHSTGRGCLTFAGRDGSDYTGKLPYIEKEVARHFPPDTALDGEIVSVDRGDVQSIFFTKGVPHIPTVGSPALTYVIFDILRANGQDVRDLPWSERRALLEAAQLGTAQHLRLTDLHPCNKRTYQVAVATGFEGVVCKLKSSRYVSGGRGHSWLKIKAEWTVEAIVDSWEHGKGSHTNRMGALNCRLLDENDQPQEHNGKPIQIRVGGGFTDAIREDVRDNFRVRWSGAVIEVKHNGITANGKVLGPNFVCLRDDRSPAAAKPKPKPRTTSQPRTPAAGSWVRNYGAMGEPKLRAALRDFSIGRGDAVDRVHAKQGSLQVNIARAKEAARAKGIPIPPEL